MFPTSDSRGGTSDVESEIEVLTPPGQPIPVEKSLSSLSEEICPMIHWKRASRAATRVASTKTDQGDASRSSRGWKFFLFFPTFCCTNFQRSCVEEAIATHDQHGSCQAMSKSGCRSHRQDQDNLESRSTRAEALTKFLCSPSTAPPNSAHSA